MQSITIDQYLTLANGTPEQQDALILQVDQLNHTQRIDLREALTKAGVKKQLRSLYYDYSKQCWIAPDHAKLMKFKSVQSLKYQKVSATPPNEPVHCAQCSKPLKLREIMFDIEMVCYAAKTNDTTWRNLPMYCTKKCALKAGVEL